MLRSIVLGIYVLPAALFWLLRIRILTLTHPDRIGHLCIEPDCYIKEGLLGLRHRFFGIFLIPKAVAANRVLLALWAKKLTILTSSFWCRILLPFARLPFSSYPIAKYAVAINDTALCATIEAKWKGRRPLLTLPRDLSSKGWEALRELGLPPGAWYVCVHSREGGYSPGDENLHSFRNSEIESYRLAMQAIVDRGGWCMRVGEASTKPLAATKGVFDYAHSSLKSEWMDLFLCANCLFFLGNSSGLHLLSSVFGVPSALANLIPVSSSLPVMPGDIGIPKVLKKRGTGETLKFVEILASPLGDYRFAERYAEEGILVEDNTPEDIRDLALEMLEQCRGTFAYTPEDEALQRRFQSLFREGHYSFGADSRIGRSFLRKYADIV